MSDSPIVGVIGLGRMGSAYAALLLKAGRTVVGFDTTPAACDALTAVGGRVLASPAAVAAKADVVLVALPSVATLEAVTDGSGGMAGAIRPGTVVCEMSTLPIPAKERMAEVLERDGAICLDAPVSGTGAQAAVGDLLVYASGDEAAVDRIRPVLDDFSRGCRHVGPFGAGMKLKLVANLLVTIHNVAAAEALLLAKRSGLDLDMVFDAISSGAGTSRMFEVRGPMMIEECYTPPTMTQEVYAKDLALIMEHAQATETPVPLMSATLPLYAAALASGRRDEDTASVFAVLKDMTGG